MRDGPAKHRRVATAIWVVAGLALVPGARPADAHDQPVTVAVDAAKAAGATNPNLVGFAFDPRVDRPGFAPLAARTFRLDVGFERLVACPQPTLRADRLGELQAKLDEIDALGAEPILILTYMAPCLADTYPGDPRDPTRLPPRDPAAWQKVVTELVTATGPGRAAAGKRPVRYYEVWNEPDWVFWQDTQARFTAGVLLPSGRAVASVAKASGLDLRFGLCGCLFADPSWMVPLMAETKAASIPVGFLSWHYYGNYPFIGPDGLEPGFPPQSKPLVSLLGQRNPAASPEAYLLQLDQVRTWAQATLGRVPELMVDEWNLSAGGFDRRMDTNEGAAFQAATLAALASGGLDRALLFHAVDPYDRDIDGNPLPSRYGGWGVVDRTLVRKPAWYAHWLWTRLGPVRLDSPQDVADGVWSAAGASADRTRVDLLVASFVASGAHDHVLHLTMAGLHPGAWFVSLWRVDAAHPGSTDPAQVVHAVAGPDGRLALDTALPAQSVVLAELERPVASPSGPEAGVKGQFMGANPAPTSALPATGGPAPVAWAFAFLGAAVVLQVLRRRSHRPAPSTAAPMTSGTPPPVSGVGR